ncbi:hypothetical protein VNO80_19240 [Phaseolus coccineus]|uniref:Uncharacterized protein n=1 Tax=Phaseolus coccineus TaxID=3886 RepID=A0AAN9MKI4_PHACN
MEPAPPSSSSSNSNSSSSSSSSTSSSWTPLYSVLFIVTFSSPASSSRSPFNQSSDDGTCRIWDARNSHNPRIYVSQPQDAINWNIHFVVIEKQQSLLAMQKNLEDATGRNKESLIAQESKTHEDLDHALLCQHLFCQGKARML